MEGETGGTSTSTPLAMEGIANSTKKRTASTSPGKDDQSDLLRCGQRKCARDDNTNYENIYVKDTGDMTTGMVIGADTGSELKGSITQSNSIPQGQQVNTFNSSIFSDDLNATDSTTLEIFGIKDSLLSDLKALSKKWPQNEKHDVACQSSSLLITPLVKTLFSSNVSPGKQDLTQGNSLGKDLASSEKLAINYSLENNLFLRAIASKIDSIAGCVGEQAKTIDTLDTTILEVEKQVEKNKVELSARIDDNKQSCGFLRESIGKAFEYTDTKFANLKDAMPLVLAEVGGDLEKRIEAQNKTLLSKVQEELGKHPISGALVGGLEDKFREKLSLFENQTNHRLGRLEEQRLNLEIKTNEISGLKEEVIRQREKMNEMELQHNAQIRELSNELKTVSESLRTLNSEDKPIGNGGFITRNEWRMQKQKIEEVQDRISSVETNMKISAKKTDAVDLIVRKNNIIIDQLSEIDGEEIGHRVCEILRNTMWQEDLFKIKVLRVFRLGVRRAGGPPRKVLLELDNPMSRDIVLANARYITKSGNDGKPYYLNEDIPEEVRRWKNDLQKYMKYMGENGHRVEKVGDDLIIDGRRWKTSDLNQLPEGQRLMDSRTIAKAGKVAFQSSISPLSNLFPCTIRVEGQTFKSVEHAYNYMKGIHHGMPCKAREIKDQPNAYRAMNLGREITPNIDWLNKRINVLERLVKEKQDQVPIFREMLRKTGSHRLIENSWSQFWGSGCNFLAEVLWDGTYKGQNNFGRILERVRDNS